MKLINIGFGNLVSADRLVAVVGPASAPQNPQGHADPPRERFAPKVERENEE